MSDLVPCIFTQILPRLFHIILLPKGLFPEKLKLYGRQQALANQLPTWLLTDHDGCLIYEGGTSWSPHSVPAGAYTAGKLREAETFLSTSEFRARSQALRQFVEDQQSDTAIEEDPAMLGRPATVDEIITLSGNQPNGVPKGLAKCRYYNLYQEWEGECLDPSSPSDQRIIEVHCRIGGNKCVQCGTDLAEGPLNRYSWTNRGGKEQPGHIQYVSGRAALDHCCDLDNLRERDIDWKRVGSELTAGWSSLQKVPKFEIIAPKEAVNLRELIAGAAKAGEACDYAHENFPEYIDERWPVEKLLSFEWASLGAMTWNCDILSMDIGDGSTYVMYTDENERTYFVVAGIKGQSTSWAAYSCILIDLLTTIHGHNHRVFGDLPTRTYNSRPDLFPADVVKNAYWAWMREHETAWVSLRNSVIDQLVREDPKTSGETLRRFFSDLPPFSTQEELFRWMEKRKEKQNVELGELSEDDRLRILDNYFAQSYSETTSSFSES